MKRNWTTTELIEFFTITPNDFKLIANKTGYTRLGFAVLLKYFQKEACFPINHNEIPEDLVNFFSKQLELEATLFQEYKLTGRTYIQG